MSTLAIIGTGVMGETVLAGLLRAGWSAGDIIGVDRFEARLREIESRHGVRTLGVAEATAAADTVLLAVKPQDVPATLADMAAEVTPSTLVISLCAGVSTASLEDGLPSGTRVVRVMPNTPAQVSAGMSAVSAGQHATSADVDRVVAIMGAVGEVVVVPEGYQDAVTAVSGSGPAYLFYVAEAMIDAGVKLGLPRDIASQLATQTLLGSAKLLSESGEHPTVLRERVTSPAGTTAAAIATLDERAVKAAFAAAMEAARDRSIALGNR